MGIFFLIFSLSCRKSNTVSSLPKVDTTVVNEADSFKINEIDFTYFHFKSKVEYTSGSEAQSFSVNGRIKKDSIIWLSITPGLGIEAARCMILKDSVHMLDRIHNKYFVYGFDYINQTFNTNLNFYNLQALLLGNLAFPKDSKDKLIKQEDKNNYLLRQNRGNLKIDNFVQAQTRKIESLEVQNLDNNTAMALQYSEFAPLDSFRFANHIKVLVNFVDEKGMNKSTLIDVQHHKAEIETKPLNFPFNVPKRFEDK